MKTLFILIISIIISCSSSKPVIKEVTKEAKPLLEEGSGKVVKTQNTLEPDTDYKIEMVGFKLGQYKSVVHEKFGVPYESQTYDDGYEADIFLLDSLLPNYVIFKYPSWNKNIIYSIQFFGHKEGLDPKIDGLMMGISEEVLIKKYGEPNNIVDVGKYGKRFEYSHLNYSFEINTDGKLSSILLRDRFTFDFSEPNFDQVPSFEIVKETLMSKDRNKIGKMLSGSVEIYSDGNTHFFKSPWEEEIAEDKSKLFDLIDQLAKGLDTIDSDDINQYEENLRISQDLPPRHVLKFKTDIALKEIVFHWEYGRFVIWEIKS